MENIENEEHAGGKIINMAEYQTNKALIGILNRPSLEEQMKKYPSSKPTMKVVYNKEKEQELLRHILKNTKSG